MVLSFVFFAACCGGQKLRAMEDEKGTVVLGLCQRTKEDSRSMFQD